MRRRRSEAKRANRMPCVTSWPESYVTLTLLYGVALFKQNMNTRYPLFVKWERRWGADLYQLRPRIQCGRLPDPKEL